MESRAGALKCRAIFSRRFLAREYGRRLYSREAVPERKPMNYYNPCAAFSAYADNVSHAAKMISFEPNKYVPCNARPIYDSFTPIPIKDAYNSVILSRGLHEPLDRSYDNFKTKSYADSCGSVDVGASSLYRILDRIREREEEEQKMNVTRWLGNHLVKPSEYSDSAGDE